MIFAFHYISFDFDFVSCSLLELHNINVLFYKLVFKFCLLFEDVYSNCRQPPEAYFRTNPWLPGWSQPQSRLEWRQKGTTHKKKHKIVAVLFHYGNKNKTRNSDLSFRFFFFVFSFRYISAESDTVIAEGSQHGNEILCLWCAPDLIA